MSKSPYTPPVITVAFDLDSGSYDLMATSHRRTAPAGERLFRGYPHPEVRFSHDSEEAALRDAATLRSYLADCVAGKRKDVEPMRKGWWQD